MCKTEKNNWCQQPSYIVRSSVAAPSPTWEDFVVTGKARTRIRRFVRSQEREQYLALGRGIAEKAFRAEGQEFLLRATLDLKEVDADEDA